jgi:hypothetical protein
MDRFEELFGKCIQPLLSHELAFQEYYDKHTEKKENFIKHIIRHHNVYKGNDKDDLMSREYEFANFVMIMQENREFLKFILDIQMEMIP